MQPRKFFLAKIEKHFSIHKVCALLGPRQCGKTTLAKVFANHHKVPKVNFFDLENPLDIQRLTEPMLTLSRLKGIIIIDEIQFKPDLFPIIRVIVDNQKIRFLFLGSASRDLINKTSETLAGRIGYVEMTPFRISEVDNTEKLWIRGGFPLSYVAKDEESSFLWRQNYIQTFLERDIPKLGISIPSLQLRRFWLMICHYHGQIFNATELGKSLGISYHTAQRYLGILQGAFMIRVLQPWYENIKKRQVKTPKIYFRDSGIYHALLGLSSQESLEICPKIGASWEGFALEEVIRLYDAGNEECYFWSSHDIGEIDLLIIKNGKRIGFEFKYTSSPKITSSIGKALDILNLNQIRIIYPGDISFALSDKVEAVGLTSLLSYPL
jgi:uncharacterized protein